MFVSSKSTPRSKSVSRITVTTSVTVYDVDDNTNRTSSFGKPLIQKKPEFRDKFNRDPINNSNNGYGPKVVNGKLQVKQPLADWQAHGIEKGTVHTLLEYGVGRKRVRVLGMGTYDQSILDDGHYNSTDGITTVKGFSPFTKVVYLELLD